MKKIIFFIALIYLSIETFGQLPPIVEFDKVITVGNNIIEIPLDDFTIIETPQTPAGTINRRVYFIHGLGGDASAWVKVANAFENPNLNISGFPARKVETSLINYSYYAEGDLRFSANKVRNDIRNQASHDFLDYGMIPSDAFIIAHSQGGLVSRTLLHIDFIEDINNRPPFGVGYGGLVTVASPLQGAMILNKRDDILIMAEKACVSLIAGPTSENPIALNLIENIINKIGKTNDGIDGACHIVTHGLLPIFFADYYDAITEYYKVGAPWINTLNEDANDATYCNMPKVAFYGVEPKENIFWRTVNWFTTDPNSVDYFAANNDLDFYYSFILPEYNRYVKKTNDYQAKADKAMKAYKCQIWWNRIGALISLGCYNNYYKKRTAWYKGVQFFWTVNEEWETIIGARVYDKYPNNPSVPSYTYYPNDGVVLQKSAADLPCATNEPVELYNSSHMQIRNDENIKIHMKKLLDGQYGDFFETKIK
ncbi:MAG TPA: hypothetical protein PLP76_10160 [Bacteroidales bacterium]|nr:hypothetical protein [Bacteroidales bacterium]HPJ92249.1 hypothetical protein [Bacteroidales bacterium]